MSPIEILKQWLIDEKSAGAPNPQQAILASCGKDAIPHARVVAVREIDEQGLLFFTQSGTRKVKELVENPLATMTFWFELLQREVIIEGIVTPLLQDENKQYWDEYPREAKIRFCSYAPTSSQPINSKDLLEKKKKEIENEYASKDIPFSQYYRGFRLEPSRVVFYAYRVDELSDVYEYCLNKGAWTLQLLSP